MNVDRNRFPRNPQPGGDAVLARLDALAAEEARRRRLLVHAAFAAALLHLLVALLVPRLETRSAAVAATAREIFRVLPTPRFAPPPARVELAAPRARRVPVPDPTPEDPEPLRAYEPPAVELPLAIDGELGALPSPPPAFAAPEVHFVGGEVLRPPKLFAPPPVYPEPARRIRKQGTVVLRLRLDAAGAIVGVEPLTALGFGLEDAAVDAVSRWRFGPATYRGEPVAVVYLLSVQFALTN